jgi:hypothetical protein
MPNWVFNYVTVRGDEESIKKIKEQVSQPFSQPEKDWQTNEVTIVEVKPAFSFWNIVRVPEDKIDLYHETHGYADGKATGDTEWNWYNFNNREWGTKWDVASTAVLEEEGADFLCYRFDTAWAPPVGALNALSAQYPTVTIQNDWEEKQGFGSTLIHRQGSESEEDEYDYRCYQCDAKKISKSGGYREDAEATLCLTDEKLSNRYTTHRLSV